MKLTLEQSNIETAVRAYLQATYGLSLRNKETVMEFKAGRGSNGVSVNVTIEDATIPGGEVPSQLVGNAEQPKQSAADKIVAAVNSAPEGTMGALIAAVEPAPVADQPVVTPIADLPSTTTAESPVVVAGEVPPQENGTSNPFEGSDTQPAVEPELETTNLFGTADIAAPAPAVEAEVPAVTTEAAVEAEVAAPVKTTSGLFS